MKSQTLNLLKKEIVLGNSVQTVCWLICCFGMYFVPSYPCYIGPFYITLAIMLTFALNQSSHDILYTVLLPVRKIDTVKARFLYCGLLEILALGGGTQFTLLSVERQVEGRLYGVICRVGHHRHNGITRLRQIGRTLHTGEVGVDTCHTCHEFREMSHDVAALRHRAIASAVLSVTQHAVETFGGIVDPSVEVAHHASVDSMEKVEKVLGEVEVATRRLVLIPVDEILRHPYLFALLGQILVSCSDTAILVTAIDVEALKDIGLVQRVDIAIGTTN